VNRNPTGASGAEPINEATRAKLIELVTRGGNGILLADFPGVGGAAMARALTGKPVRPATRALIRLGLERLAAEKNLSDREKECDAGIAGGCGACKKCDPAWWEKLRAEEAAKEKPKRYELSGDVECSRCKASIANGHDGLCAACRLAYPFGPSDLGVGTTQPVCPRCLDIVPGTPGGTPEEPHPGPFTEDLCAACHKAIDASLEPEERAEARRVRAAREKAVKP
jgi:hypothetical protein